MSLVWVLRQLWQKGSERGPGIAHKAEVNLGTASELLAAKIDLNHRRVFGKELLIREVGSDHQQQIAVHHRLVSGRESEKAGHAHIEGVVVLDELLPPHRVYDRSLQFAREFDQLGMRSSAARARKDRDPFRAAQNFR